MGKKITASILSAIAVMLVIVGFSFFTIGIESTDKFIMSYSPILFVVLAVALYPFVKNHLR